MHDDLRAALEPVLRDLAAPDGVLLKVLDEPWADLPGVASAMIATPDGWSMGVQVEVGRPRAAQVTRIADQVQEWAVEALWTLGRPTNWPRCPHHPDGHPLAPAERDGRAVWICPSIGDPIREIGQERGFRTAPGTAD